MTPEQVEELARRMEAGGASRHEVKEALFALRYGLQSPINLNKYKETSMQNPITLTLKLTNVEDGRVRAEIPDAGLSFGVFAEAADAQTAAAQAVKAYLSAQPVPTAPQVAKTTPFADATPVQRPRLLGRRSIENLMDDLMQSGGKARIEYEDQTGHRTTRVIHPKDWETGLSGQRVVAYDELRDGVRTFTLASITSAQEVE